MNDLFNFYLAGKPPSDEEIAAHKKKCKDKLDEQLRRMEEYGAKPAVIEHKKKWDEDVAKFNEFFIEHKGLVKKNEIIEALQKQTGIMINTDERSVSPVKSKKSENDDKETDDELEIEFDYKTKRKETFDGNMKVIVNVIFNDNMKGKELLDMYEEINEKCERTSYETLHGTINRKERYENFRFKFVMFVDDERVDARDTRKFVVDKFDRYVKNSWLKYKFIDSVMMTFQF